MDYRGRATDKGRTTRSRQSHTTPGRTEHTRSNQVKSSKDTRRANNIYKACNPATDTDRPTRQAHRQGRIYTGRETEISTDKEHRYRTIWVEPTIFTRLVILYAQMLHKLV